MADATKIQLGPCSVTYKGRDMGHTIGGAAVTYTPDFYESKVDKYGSSIVEKFLVGEKFMAEFSLAEFTLANLQDAINQSTLQGDDSVSVGSVAGKKASANAGLLVRHPLAFAAAVRDYDVAIYRGVITSELKIEHKNDGEKVLPIVVDGIVDEGRSDGNMLGFIGDSIS